MRQSGGSLSGALCLNNHPCVTQGTLSGTTTADAVTLGVSFSGSEQGTFTGAVSGNGGMGGTYVVVGGACSGYGGTWSFTRTASDPSQGNECAVCSTDDQCGCPFVCSRFSDGSLRCGSGAGTTTCRVP